MVARGTPPREDENARIELKIDPDRPLEVDENERVDHWSRSTLVNVAAGQEVAVKHPAVPGENGTTVIGSAVKAAVVKDIAFPAGSGLGGVAYQDKNYFPTIFTFADRYAAP